jgi:hypothetical protein
MNKVLLGEVNIMRENLIVNDDNIKKVVKESKCSFRHEMHSVSMTGGLGTDAVGSNGKLLDTQKYTFTCGDCGRHFLIPKPLYHMHKRKES